MSWHTAKLSTHRTSAILSLGATRSHGGGTENAHYQSVLVWREHTVCKCATEMPPLPRPDRHCRLHRVCALRVGRATLLV